MTELRAETQENDARRALLPESRAFSELDLALVDALQTAPRAPWTRIGRALGVDATTVARRWERLRDSGLAWITGYDAARTATVGYVEVRCRPRSAAAVSAAVARLPWVFSVEETDGAHDLFLSVVATDLPTLGRSVREAIGALPGVRAVRTRLGITQYGEGSDWRTRALEPADRAALGERGRHGRTTEYSTHMYDRPAPEDQALLAALAEDGRLGWTELAARTGVGEHAARRRLGRMLREGAVTIRCDLARPLAGLSAALVYRARVPHGELERTGAALARLEQVRLCASVSGPHNLLLGVWLPGLAAVAVFESHLADRFPALEIGDRAVVLNSPKRMGRLLDERGRAIGRIPFGLPGA
ncbi:DNA-binding Lrp family transcriptional regulator [Streptomyces sp. Ag109_O5-1]|nr:DNA-binding Lrp family transcriptional regulator [Streptomyces sp. Ag109_O5-1]